jgi:hypothetical protein
MEEKKTSAYYSTQNAPGPNTPQGGKYAKLAVLRHAEILEEYTARAVFNDKIFPKKYRPAFTNNILMVLFEVIDALTEANELDLRVPGECEERIYLQRKALRSCKKLLNRITTAYHLKIINDDKFTHWTRLVVNVKNLAGAWAKSDEKRKSSSEPVQGRNL